MQRVRNGKVTSMDKESRAEPQRWAERCKGRASYKAQTGGTLKAPVKSGDNPRRASFLARMGNMRGPERDSKGKTNTPVIVFKSMGCFF